MINKVGPVVAGVDIGKKRSPSHISVFECMDNILTQIHQKFLDGWDYTRQVEYFIEAIEFFKIDYLYYDNTRGEMEERHLPQRICIPIVLSEVNKRRMANSFSKLIEQKKIRLLSDDRFEKQILCVRNDLHAPETPMGHGDSFFSVMLAIAAYEDHFGALSRENSRVINLSSFVSSKEEVKNNASRNDISVFPKIEIKNKCIFCGKVGYIEQKQGGGRFCGYCLTNF